MLDCYALDDAAAAIPLIPVGRHTLDAWLEAQPERVRHWVADAGFTARANSRLRLPGEDGRLGAVLLGVHEDGDAWAFGGAAAKLPAGQYRITADWDEDRMNRAAIAWGLGAYRYDRYKTSSREQPRLVLDSDGALTAAETVVRAVYLVRDLINTPAADMMPADLAAATHDLAAAFGGEVREIVGEDLLAENYPALHAVGRASIHAPRLIDLRWGEAGHPPLTLVGKGVCFDSGGLDIKPAAGMRQMKKDMGGAAHVLGLARLIMARGLPVRLRVLIGAAENAIAGNAFRPGDVLRTRKGLTVEVDNTDAEGRLAICDALAESAADEPRLLIDFATLTGAARVALGTEVPAFFTNADEVAAGLMQASLAEDDPIWRLPLHRPYRSELDSDIADLVNSAADGFGGAITAALFLERFIPRHTDWVHFDVMAWNNRARPGRPKGGEAMGLYATYRYLEERFRPKG